MKHITFFIFLICTMVKSYAQDLRITEIMYNPSNSDSAWEWIEIYNASTERIDLTGYVVDDNSGAAYSEANIPSGTMLPGASAILFNASSITDQEFSQVWGQVDVIPVTRWSSLNNGGDSIGIWSSFNAYEGDNVSQENVIEQIVYLADGEIWPEDDGSASIYLTDLDLDNTNGSNWSLSTPGVTTPLYKSYISMVFEMYDGQDIGSPGLAGSIDTEKPTVTCPEDINMVSDTDNCGATFPFLTPTGTDNTNEELVFKGIRNDGLELTDVYPIGLTTITWTAIDEAGNISESCDQLVLITDNVAPSISCPEAVELLSIDGRPVLIDVNLATGSNVCDGNLTITGTRSDGKELEEPFALGETIVRWIATDNSGNMSECEQLVTVNFNPSMEKIITSFLLPNQLGDAIIDQDNKTVLIKVSFGTAISALVPIIEISEYATVSPATEVAQDFINPITYTISAQDNSEQVWIVTVEIEEEVEENQLKIVSFVLVNAETNEDLFLLEEGMQINIKDLPTMHLDIRANTTQDVESVRLSLDGAQTTARTESLIPYALYQDLPIGDYKGNQFVLGTYEVTAIPYSGDSLLGEIGTPSILNFEFIDPCESFEVTLEMFENILDTENPIALSGGFPEGGTYSGAGVKNGVFDPSIGEGIYEISYVFIDLENGCEDSVNQSITVLSTRALEIESFTLINADTNEDLFEIIEGMKIDLNSLPTKHLDIRANATSDVESVKLALSGSQISGRTESLVPYALFQDLPIGNYKGNNFTVGNYVVTGVPYSKDNATGSLGSSFNINFELINSSIQIIDFTLVNAETDEDLFIITEGMVININDLPTLNLDIRANTTDDVGSVRLSIAGALNSSRIESLVPYALFQDLPIGDYKGSNFQIGAYSVIGEPFSKNSGLGTQGTNITVNFELIDTVALTGKAISDTSVLAPNPASNQTRLSFENKVEIISIDIYDNLGRVVLSFIGEDTHDGEGYLLQTNSLTFGNYFVLAQDEKGIIHQQQLIIRY